MEKDKEKKIETLESQGKEFYENPGEGLEKATFAAGCFWGVESAFRQVPGVVATAVGYSGGTLENPSYEVVCTDRTGHAEAMRLVFDPGVVSYEELLKVFWHIHDPTTKNRQGPDVGSQYRSVIFYYDEVQKKAAFTSKEKLDKSGKFKDPVVTEIIPAEVFYFAEAYHQQYFEKKSSYKGL